MIVPQEAARKVMRSCTTRLAVDLVARLITIEGMKWDSSRIADAIMEFGERSGADDALQLLRAAEGAGVPLKAGVYTLVMNTCARAHRFDKVEGLLNDVRKARLPLTQRDYACILSAFYKLERWRVSEIRAGLGWSLPHCPRIVRLHVDHGEVIAILS